MRFLLSPLAAFCVVAGTAAPAIAAEMMAVPIDQTSPIALPPGTQNVVVGNPAIADVNILDSRNAVVLGRSYGVTNLMVMDARGRILLDRQIVVSTADAGRVTVVRGGAPVARVENYGCSPRCERTPMPGEADIDYNRYVPPYTSYGARAAEGRAAGAAKSNP